MPKVLSVRERMTAPLFCSSRGSTCWNHMSWHSTGGPGMRTMVRPSFSTHQPGAVPARLGRAVADGMSVACLRLLSGISMFRRVKNLVSVCRSSGWMVISSPTSAAVTSRVMSPLVGPRPPVVMMRSARSQAWRSTPE